MPSRRGRARPDRPDRARKRWKPLSVAREGRAAKQRRAAELFARLRAEYPDAHCELDFRTPYELLVATILSAQCTDARVNQVTPAFFRRYPTPRALAAAGQPEVEELVRPTGFFRNKARSLIGMAQALTERHQGLVPRTMESLRELPGVGRKTANVILGNAYGINDGVTVDTHVNRLSRRLGLTREAEPEAIEQDLMALFPRADWTMLSHLLIWHGRRVCLARKPRCGACVVNPLCPSAEAPPGPVPG